MSLRAVGAHPQPGPQPPTACRVLGPRGWGPRMEATLPKRPINPHIACLWAPEQRSHHCALLQNKGSRGHHRTGREQGWVRPWSSAWSHTARREGWQCCCPRATVEPPRTNPYTPGRTPICRNPRRPESAVARVLPPEAYPPLLGGWRGSRGRLGPLAGDQLPGTLSWALWLRGRP